ncbi:MAG: ATP-binding protein [Verrucomicrobiota bacterium]
MDLWDVKGQAQGRRALEIAAAGGQNLIFVGPPGSGKIMPARKLSTDKGYAMLCSDQLTG